MAALQTLRTKAGLFISICIGLGLLAFIMGDLLSSNSIFTNSDVVGKVDGEKIKIDQFQRKIDEQEEFEKIKLQAMSLTDSRQTQIRENVWNSTINEIVFGKVYENAGIVVTGDEIVDMVIGNHISPMMYQVFGNPQTGAYDKAYAQNFLANKNQDPRAAFFWQVIEKDLINSRLTSKYSTLIQKSVYCTDAQIKAEEKRRAESSNVAIVSVRYSTIADSLISISNAEIKAEYSKNKELYKVNDSRDIEYVSFPIKPTEEDNEETFKVVEELKADFASEETDAYRFAQMNAENPEPERFLGESQLDPKIADFVKGAKAGEVYGPYRDGNSYKICRFVSVAQRPDSVKASHILIRDNETLADSLFEVAKKGNKFDELARKFSEDSGSAINGGDLDWFNDGVMVPEFNEACFTGKKGDIVKIKSQFGTHIIKITDKGVNNTKYSIATIDKSIQYSNKTQQLVYSDASKFLANVKNREQFNTMIDSMNLVKRYAQNIRSNAQTFNSVKSARDVVKWTYKAELDEISTLFECGDEYIVAVLVKKQDKGYANIEDVSAMIARELRNEKKAAMISENNKGKNLEEIAAAYNTKIDSATVNFTSNNIIGIGTEPALIGSVVAANKGEINGAVKGNNAAYYFIVNEKTNNESISAEAIKMEYLQKKQSVSYEASNAILNAADIDDNRINFY